MFKFLHIADVHLDTTFLSRSVHVRKALRVAVQKSLENAVSFSISEKLDALLIAGDLFDDDRLSFATERFLIEQLFRLDRAGIKCFYATGNHDPGGASSRVRKMTLPASFVCFDEVNPRTVAIERDGNVIAHVVGAGHESEREGTNLAATFPKARDGVPTIGLLHTLVASASTADRHDRYAPCSVDDLRGQGYAYWALGHVHERQKVSSESTIRYSGNTQGRTPKEAGHRGGLVVTVGSRSVRTQFVPLHSIEWLDVTIDALESVNDASALERTIRTAFESAVEDTEFAGRRMLRVTLKGPTPLATKLIQQPYVKDVESDLKNELGVLDLEIVSSGVRPLIDVEQYRDGQHLLGEVLSLIEEVGENDALLDELGPVPIADVSSATDDRIAYLRTLLTDLSAEAASRLLVEEG